ncbi:HNH endonuclease [Cellulomonas alba]|uniref:HNH endonuclease signature motif containing protein n=1 Tax=Cellulomonas alba TaxID=3053467 RepID=A0ABT7SHS1_9CELL|nr:HNH endonuclease signature motif containing protein [Cellulomonas alba]MDM7855730.1 HNH endonuclease signature motif containing protein [Cellulomonas alba]
MPHTFAALETGHLSEHRALLLVRETACLPVEVRAEVDRLVCGDVSALAGIGTKRLVALARSHAARLDPASLAARARRAETERSVTLRPAPDTMTYLTALLPVAQGVAVLAALRRAADSARAAGDPRSRGQVMADTLVERVTGQRAADSVPVTVNLVMSDAALLGAAHDGAVVDGHGSVPAQVARNLVAHGLDAGAAWLRRLYAGPAGDLLATTSSARFHAPGLAALLRVRDQGLCRTPYCDAPARELDHVVPAADGGATDLENAQGLCVACNRAKQARGWRQRPDPATRDGVGRHTVLTTTPTGHTYRSTAPPPPSPLEHPSRPSGPRADDGSSPGAPFTGGVLGSDGFGAASPRRPQAVRRRSAGSSVHRARSRRREAVRRRAFAEMVAGPSPVDATFQALVDGHRGADAQV